MDIYDMYEERFLFENGIREPYVEEIENAFLLSDTYYTSDGRKMFRLETAKRFDTYEEAWKWACFNDVVNYWIDIEVAERGSK